MAQAYTNDQRAVAVDGIGGYVTTERAAELIGIERDTLDMQLRRWGWLVLMVGHTRLIPLRDISELRRRQRA